MSSAYLAVYLLVGIGLSMVAKTLAGLPTSKGSSLNIVLAVLFIAGQALPYNAYTYPFVRWGMYADPRPPRAVRFYRFTDNAGRSGNYPFGLVASGSIWPLQARIDERLFQCRCSAEDALLDAFLGTLDEVYVQSGMVRIRAFEVIDIPIVRGRLEHDLSRLRYSWSNRRSAPSSAIKR